VHLVGCDCECHLPGGRDESHSAPGREK
jgi:hypothetical protein